MTDSSPIEIYTDGACKGNPGAGGWGAILCYGAHQRELCGGEAHTTNNRMELLAVIQALLALKRPCKIQLYTDSKYVQQGIMQWIHAWKAKGWKKSDGKPVKNEDLWKTLDRVQQPHQIEWCWVKGHAGHPLNERADALANAGILKIKEAVE